jgi:hypothetical protein
VLLATRQKLWIIPDLAQPTEPKLLLDNHGDWRFGEPAATCDGARILIWRNRTPPSEDAPPAIYAQMAERDDMGSQLLSVDPATGEYHILLEEPRARSNHVQPSPTDTDLVLLDRDLPPGYHWFGDHGATSRIWCMRLSDQSLWQLPPLAAKKFQIHSTWSHDGQLIYYHGRTVLDIGTPTPHYIGACTSDGSVVWERE